MRALGRRVAGGAGNLAGSRQDVCLLGVTKSEVGVEQPWDVWVSGTGCGPGWRLAPCLTSAPIFAKPFSFFYAARSVLHTTSPHTSHVHDVRASGVRSSAACFQGGGANLRTFTILVD